MLKNLYFLIFGFSILLTSCSEKVNINGDFKETAVVYGLLDHSDSLHFVKITRAFIGPGNALEIAQIPDSNYFQKVDATIAEYVNGNLTRTFVLKDTIVSNKDTNGVFYAPGQKVYYFRTLPTTGAGTIQTSSNPMLTSLNPDATYKFRAVINDGQFEVTGQTELVKGITSTLSSQNFTFKFSDDPGKYIATGVSVSNSGTSFIVNAQLDLVVHEFVGSQYTTKKINWQVGEGDVLPADSRVFSAQGETFFNIIKANVTNDPTITKRKFGGIWVTLTGGAEDLYNYMTVNKPSSTLAQSKPTYTNLSVTNGKRVIGIFSSRQTVKIWKPFYTSAQQAYIRAIDKKTTRELCTGQITGNLLFCSDHPGDNVVNQQEPFACQ